MRVAYLVADNQHLASYRYRIAIPGRNLQGLGVDLVSIAQTNDVDALLVSKHRHVDGEVSDQTPIYRHIFRAASRGQRIVFDICDDHFDGPYRDYYMRVCEVANVVVASTATLAAVIEQETGRQAVVIEDPYEWAEVVPRHRGGNGVFWFGHLNNAPAFADEMHRLAEWRVYAVSNAPGCVPYSAEAMQVGFDACDAVILPMLADRRWQCKGANRMVEAIRQGRYVVAHRTPAYDGLGMWIGDIVEGLEWARSHPQRAMEAVRHAQEIVRTRFDPSRIAGQWREVFNGDHDV